MREAAARQKRLQTDSICAATSMPAWVRSNRWPQRSGLWDALDELCWGFPKEGACSAEDQPTEVSWSPTNWWVSQQLVSQPTVGGSARREGDAARAQLDFERTHSAAGNGAAALKAYQALHQRSPLMQMPRWSQSRRALPLTNQQARLVGHPTLVGRPKLVGQPTVGGSRQGWRGSPALPEQRRG